MRRALGRKAKAVGRRARRELGCIVSPDNANNDTLEVHRDPALEEARYANVVAHASHTELSVAALPDCTLRLAELFGTE